MAAGSMLQQSQQQSQQRKAEQAAMEANAKQMELSPWTGVKPAMMNPSAGGGLGEIAGAGMQGYMMGSMFNAQNPAAAGAMGGMKKPQPQGFTKAEEDAFLNSPSKRGGNIWAGMDQQYRKPSLYGGQTA